MKKVFAAAAFLGLSVSAQAFQADFSKVEIETTDLGNGIYMLKGAGGNIGVSVGSDGVFVIDDQFAPLTPKILNAIGNVTDKPVDYVINTHWHFDHTGGNENLGKAGARIVAHDNVRVRMANAGNGGEDGIALPVITFSDTTTFHYNGHEIHAFHPAHAHTDGDSIIHFRNLNLIHAGDVLFNRVFPFIDVSSGGSVDGFIAALEKIVAISDEATVIIPGHGAAANREDVKANIDMLKKAKANVIGDD